MPSRRPILSLPAPEVHRVPSKKHGWYIVRERRTGKFGVGVRCADTFTGDDDDVAPAVAWVIELGAF